MDEQADCAPVGRRILIVDDSVEVAESAALLLRLLGHTVEVAHNGCAALEAARAFRPEVILLDVGLPGMTGYEVARALRAEPEQHGVTLAALTGHARAEDRRRAHEAGFDVHLSKPLAPGILAAFVAAPQSFKDEP